MISLVSLSPVSESCTPQMHWERSGNLAHSVFLSLSNLNSSSGLSCEKRSETCFLKPVTDVLSCFVLLLLCSFGMTKQRHFWTLKEELYFLSSPPSFYSFVGFFSPSCTSNLPLPIVTVSGVPPFSFSSHLDPSVTLLLSFFLSILQPHARSPAVTPDIKTNQPWNKLLPPSSVELSELVAIYVGCIRSFTSSRSSCLVPSRLPHPERLCSCQMQKC